MDYAMVDENLQVTNIVNYLTSNVQSIYDRIKKMYELEKEIDDNDEADIPEFQVTPCPNSKSNLATYLWVQQIMRELQKVLNSLVGFYNSVNFINIDDYSKNQTINLWVPHQVLFNGYYLKFFENNWSVINKLLDQLTNYAEENR